MALNQKDLMAYGKLGFAAAIATGWLLGFISNLVSMIPGVNLDLQAISIGTTGVGGTINTGLQTYAGKLLGILPQAITIPEWIMIGVGGALFVIAGAYVADALKLLKGDKQKKLTTVLVIAGIVTGWILSSSIGLPAIGVIIAMVVDAYVLSYILIAADDALKLKLVP